jgi:hypothetical protein
MKIDCLCSSTVARDAKQLDVETACHTLTSATDRWSNSNEQLNFRAVVKLKSLENKN